MVRVLAWMAAIVVGGACTMSNPAFEAGRTSGASNDDAEDDAEGDDSGADDGSDATSNESAESEAGSLEGSAGGESPSDSGEAENDAESSDGGRACADAVDFDWEIEILDDGEVMSPESCKAPLDLYGFVSEVLEDGVFFTQCDDCDCANTQSPLELHAPGLLPLDEFPQNVCVRFQIEWSEEVECKPIGFVASSDRIQPLRPVAIGGQDVETMPQALGGAPIGMPTIDRCECSECCEESGIAALDFGSGGGPIPQGSEDHVQGLGGNDRTWLVTVHEAHVHEDCTRSLSWNAIIDDM